MRPGPGGMNVSTRRMQFFHRKRRRPALRQGSTLINYTPIWGQWPTPTSWALLPAEKILCGKHLTHPFCGRSNSRKSTAGASARPCAGRGQARSSRPRCTCRTGHDRRPCCADLGYSIESGGRRSCARANQANWQARGSQTTRGQARSRCSGWQCWRRCRSGWWCGR